MQNSVKSLGHIKCYSSSGPRPDKSLFSSIRYYCQKICSWSRRSKTILDIKLRPYFSRGSTNLLFTGLLFTLKGGLKNTNKLMNLTPNGLNQDFNQFHQFQAVYVLHVQVSHCIMAEELSWHHSLLAVRNLWYSCKLYIYIYIYIYIYQMNKYIYIYIYIYQMNGD